MKDLLVGGEMGAEYWQIQVFWNLDANPCEGDRLQKGWRFSWVQISDLECLRRALIVSSNSFLLPGIKSFFNRTVPNSHRVFFFFLFFSQNGHFVSHCIEISWLLASLETAQFCSSAHHDSHFLNCFQYHWQWHTIETALHKVIKQGLKYFASEKMSIPQVLSGILQFMVQQKKFHLCFMKWRESCG